MDHQSSLANPSSGIAKPRFRGKFVSEIKWKVVEDTDINLWPLCAYLHMEAHAHIHMAL